MQDRCPFTMCVDVGAPRNIGWSASDGSSGDGGNLRDGLDQLAEVLRQGQPATLGFEAPVWTPRRTDLARITGRRAGIEQELNRPWAAGPGTGALGAALALMPWCLARIVEVAGPVPTTIDLQRFKSGGGLLLWEAFVSGARKGASVTHAEDARIACDAFQARWPELVSDIPAEPALNHAVSSAMAVGLSIDPKELTMAALVVSGSEPAYEK